jgi:glycosyltransferase involved in cell wall biosynthesis
MKTQIFKIIIFSRYSTSQAATRVRALQYVPYLINSGFIVEIYPILDDRAIAGRSNLYHSIVLRLKSTFCLLRKIFSERDSKSFFHIHIELFPWIPFFIERMIVLLAGKRKYSVELDDAWFHRYDQHTSRFVRYIFGKKIACILQSSSLVIAGNQYISDYAVNAGARHVEVIPTVIDLERYRNPKLNANHETTVDIIDASPEGIRTDRPAVPIVGWIGTPATTKHLLEIRDVISKLSESGIAQFVAIGADLSQLKDLPIQVIPWNESTEVESLFRFDIGIMPLPDSLFERGKCGYKLIQYMACHLPTVASPVGVNTSIVEHGMTGYLASSDDEWIRYLTELCQSKEIRNKFGEAGFKRVEQKYCLNVTGPKFASVLFDNYSHVNI